MFSQKSKICRSSQSNFSSKLDIISTNKTILFIILFQNNAILIENFSVVINNFLWLLKCTVKKLIDADPVSRFSLQN